MTGGPTGGQVSKNCSFEQDWEHAPLTYTVLGIWKRAERALRWYWFKKMQDWIRFLETVHSLEWSGRAVYLEGPWSELPPLRPPSSVFGFLI